MDPPLPAEVFAEEGAPPGKPEAHYPPCLPTIQSHGFSEFWAFQFTPDSNALATSDGNSWRVWDIRTGHEVGSATGLGSRLEIAANAKLALCFDRALATFSLLEMPSLKKIRTLEPPNPLVGFNCAAISPNGKLVAVCAGKKIVLFSLVENRMVEPEKERKTWDRVYTSMQFGSNSHLITQHHIIGEEHITSTMLWDLQGNDHPREIGAFSTHAEVLSNLVSSIDRSIVFRSGWDGQVEFVNWRKNQLLFTLQAKKNGVAGIALSADNRTLLTGHQDGSISELSFPNGTKLQNFKAGIAKAKSIALSPDGQILAVSTGREIRLLHAKKFLQASK